MKCKVGDLALVVGGVIENIGKTVTCIAIVSDAEKAAHRPVLRTKGILWRIDTKISWYKINPENGQVIGLCPDKLPLCPDHDLMPLSPPGELNITFQRDEIFGERKPPKRIEVPCRNRSSPIT